MKKLLLLALPFLLAFRPGGEPEFFSWIEPTQRVDGTVLSPSRDISAYTLRCDKDGVPAYESVIASGGMRRSNVVPGTFGPGSWVCRLYATDQEARESDGSLGVEFLVTIFQFTVEPKAPTDLSVG